MKPIVNDEWSQMIEVKKHFSSYNDYHFKGFNHLNYQPYILSSVYPLSQTLLEENRGIPDSVKSMLINKKLFYSNDLNKLSFLDYFMPFLQQNMDKLHLSLNLNDKIKQIELEKSMEKHLNYDVQLTTEEDHHITIKWYYNEILTENQRLLKGVYDGFYGEWNKKINPENYSLLNNTMEKQITPYQFQKYRQLFIYLYHLFVKNPPEENQFIIIVPRFNIAMNKHVNQFLYLLQNEHMFKYADRVYIRHLEDITKMMNTYQGRYVYQKPSRFNIRMELESYWRSKESKEYKAYEHIRPTGVVNEIEIYIRSDEITPAWLNRAISDGTKRFVVCGKDYLSLGAKILSACEVDLFKNYDIVFADRYIHKKYENDIDIIILMRDTI